MVGLRDPQGIKIPVDVQETLAGFQPGVRHRHQLFPNLRFLRGLRQGSVGLPGLLVIRRSSLGLLVQFLPLCQRQLAASQGVHDAIQHAAFPVHDQEVLHAGQAYGAQFLHLLQALHRRIIAQASQQ